MNFAKEKNKNLY